MGDPCPFVVTVASEKGGVGKTTIATNLAVYLKALREDLPVTVASFDNHFSVDSMFAIGRHAGASVAGLFAGTDVADLARMGEYGVQFLASERTLCPPDDDPLHLRRALTDSNLSGVLVLDTSPILDYFTRNALAAADLALVPVKDRPSLVNAASLHGALRQEGGDPARIWLIPSLIDARLRLREGFGMRDFLVLSARERGYKVVDTFIAKSPKVEGLATNLTSRVYPVLTHARSTAVHRQFKALATFVIERFDATEVPLARQHAPAPLCAPPDSLRLLAECPACGKASLSGTGHFFQDLRSRRRGFVHGACLYGLLQGAGLESLLAAAGMLVLTTVGPGFVGPDADLFLTLFDEGGGEVAAEGVGAFEESPFAPFLRAVTGRPFEELCRETLLVSTTASPPGPFLADGRYAGFADLRRKVLRGMAGQ